MTKENKLALVVGFALILFVGILVSDHFSTARTQQSADLLPASDPLVEGAAADDPDLLDFTLTSAIRPIEANEPTPGPLVHPRRMNDSRAQAEPETPDTVVAVRMPDLQQTPRVALAEEDAQDLPYQFHDVRRGESMIEICRNYYGDGSLARELARFNDLSDPDRVPRGMRLRIPAASDLVRGTGRPTVTAAATPRPQSPRPGGKRTYHVRPGDVLSVIAQKQLGTSRRWRELYELNRDVIDDPDRVPAGVVLKLPE